MKRYLFIRLVQSLVTLFMLSILIFVLVRLAGDPALLLLPENASQEDYLRLRAELSLDRPIPVQYLVFLGKAVQGDFGQSIRTHKPVMSSIKDSLPNSLKLVGVAFVFTMLFSIPLGTLAAVYQDSPVDMAVRVLAGLGQSLPTFWVGLMMIQLFGVKLRWFPITGMEGWQNYIMPSTCMGVFLMAGIVRLLRSSMLEVLETDFIRMARIKGITELRVVLKHALKNSLLPVVSFGSMYVAIMVTGAILIETVFNWPGFGRLSYDAIVNQDFPLIQGVILTAGALVMLTNLGTDILYAYLDPRIRYG